MADSLWNRTFALFHEAAELDPDQRAAFLDRECGRDAALRREVEELLANAGGSGLLDHSPANIGPLPVEALPIEGKRIGRYVVHSRIGRGGMGVVYDAEQESPVRRRVALKVIHPGTHPDAAARFSLERQALALMSHPHIARVFDAGVMDDGRPFIAMEYVAGVPINEYCDDRALDVSQRLELFLLVCQAVQHAHQKGIIHRDIKPSNVLVAVEDGKAMPKVIDFGVAKALHPVADAERLSTVHGTLIGTLEYMSPEQLDAAGMDADTRSDIYSLGVMLYELLAGVLPFDWAALRREGLEGLRKVARETEPPRPSRRVRGLESERASAVAERRRTTPTGMSKRLEGDLDWILLKALDRDRTRRYATAAEFADDIRRHLADEPVLAGPPSTTYRVGKFVRRHRAGVAITVALAIMLTGVAVMMTRQSLEIRRAAEVANRERVRAERVSEMMVDVFQASDPYEGRGAAVTAREVLDRSSERVGDQLADEPEVKASVLNAIGRVYGQMTVYESAEKFIRESLSIRRNLHHGDHLETAESLESLGYVLLRAGDATAARRPLEESVGMKLRLLGRDDSRRIEGLHRLGATRRSDGGYNEAQEYLREALRLSRSGDTKAALSTNVILEELGIVYFKAGDLAEAESSFREALAVRRSAGPDTPRTAETMTKLATILVQRGDNAGAEAYLREALTILEKHLGGTHERLGELLTNLGLCMHNQGKYADAEANYRRSLSIWRAHHGDTHPNGIMNINNLALLAHDQNRFAEAEELFKQTLTLQLQRLQNDHPDVALPINNIARVYHDQGRLTEAEAQYRRALEIRRKGLKADHPTIADSLAWLGKLLTEKKRLQEGEAMLREAVAIRAKAFTPDDWRVAEARSLLGGCLVAQKRYAEAEPLLVEGYAIMEKKRGKNYRRTIQALERVVALYEAWQKPEQAARHRAMLQQGRA